MPGTEIQRLLVGTQPSGSIRLAIPEGDDPDVWKRRLEDHMPPEKAAETVWSVEERSLR